jgi:hypothetical protein
MRRPQSVASLETLGRVRLSEHFFMRDFLYSEIANFHGMPNFPDFPDVAIEAGRKLCETLLEPLHARFGKISIRSAYRSPSVNAFGNEHDYNCARNDKDLAGHIWDYPDIEGRIGATASIIVNAFIPYYERTGDWQALAWWVHDHLDYSAMQFFPKFAAFNLSWRQQPARQIYSYIPPDRGWLTKPGMANHGGEHPEAYGAWLG